MARLRTYVAKTFAGLENVLAEELKALGAKNIQTANRAVSFQGSKRILYRANLCLHTALNILMPLRTFKAVNGEQLYKKALDTEWEKWWSPEQTFAIQATVYSPHFRHTGYPALKVKDAIVDRFRTITGKRPSVDKSRPDIVVHIHIKGEKCHVSLDSSGQPLFKRGYKMMEGTAPLNEVLAAGIVKLTGWEGICNLIDPMCGTGTVLTEAGMIALNIPPGSFRKRFSLMAWNDFDSRLWESVVEEAKSGIKPFEWLIFGSDKSPRMLKIAAQNIQRANLKGHIVLSLYDFFHYIPPSGKGMVIINPPYGKRLSRRGVEELYKKMGDRFKHHYKDYTVWVLTGNLDAAKFIGLKPAQKIKVFNGQLECRLLRFDIY